MMKAGDIIFSRNNSLISRIIRFFTSMQTGNAKYSHVSMGLEDNLCVEALWRVRISDMKKYAGQQIKIYRVPLSDDERDRVREGMMQVAGNGYGITKIPLFLLDSLATQLSRLWGNKKPVFWFTKTFGVFNIPVCSQLVVWGLYNFTNYRIYNEALEEVSWKIISPDYLEDLLKLEVNQALVQGIS